MKHSSQASLMLLWDDSSPCRAATSSSAEFRDADRAGRRIRWVKFDRFPLKNRNQGWLFSPGRRAATESETSSSAGSFMVRFWRFRRFWRSWRSLGGGGVVLLCCLPLIAAGPSHALEEQAVLVPSVPEAHRRVLIRPVKASHCPLSRWLTVGVIWTQHTRSHTHFFFTL